MRVDEPAPSVDEPAVGGVSVAQAGATLSVRASVPASILPRLMIEELAMRGGGWGLFDGCAAGDTGAAVVVKVG